MERHWVSVFVTSQMPLSKQVELSSLSPILYTVKNLGFLIQSKVLNVTENKTRRLCDVTKIIAVFFV